MDDLESAISQLKLAVFITPQDHPDRAIWLSNLGIRLSSRYYRTDNMTDLNEAISKLELAVSITAEDHPDRAGRLYNLGARLSDKYDRTGDMDDLEVAILKAQLTVSNTPKNHPDQAERLYLLGDVLSSQYNQTRRVDDIETALRNFLSVFDLSNAIPLSRVRAARRAISMLVIKENWEQASSLVQAAIELLPFISSRYLSRDDQQYAIMQISGLAADACSLSLKVGNVHQTLQQLEFGRGVILGNLIDGQSDVTNLQDNYPDLAKKYESLWFEAYKDIEAKEPTIWEALHNHRRDAVNRLEDCLHEIRQKNGYERFLLEPSIDELQQSAREGPIVFVNATAIGCYAIIVSASKVQDIALPEMNFPNAPQFFAKVYKDIAILIVEI